MSVRVAKPPNRRRDEMRTTTKENLKITGILIGVLVLVCLLVMWAAT